MCLPFPEHKHSTNVSIAGGRRRASSEPGRLFFGSPQRSGRFRICRSFRSVITIMIFLETILNGVDNILVTTCSSSVSTKTQRCSVAPAISAAPAANQHTVGGRGGSGVESHAFADGDDQCGQLVPRQSPRRIARSQSLRRILSLPSRPASAFVSLVGQRSRRIWWIWCRLGPGQHESGRTQSRSWRIQWDEGWQ